MNVRVDFLALRSNPEPRYYGTDCKALFTDDAPSGTIFFFPSPIKQLNTPLSLNILPIDSALEEEEEVEEEKSMKKTIANE